MFISHCCFQPLTQPYDPWLLLRTGRRTLFVLPHSKGSFSGAAVSRSVNRCLNPVRHPAGPHEPVCEKWLAGRAEPGVHHLHDRGCQEGIVLRRQQSDQAAPGTRKVCFWSLQNRENHDSGILILTILPKSSSHTPNLAFPDLFVFVQSNQKSRPFKITM